MRLIYLTDTHIRGTTPRSRTDEFPDTIRKKLMEIISIAHERKVDFVLHGGDVFDRPSLSPAVVREFASVFRQFQVPIYAIAGNHDIYGHNPATIDRTMLGLLDAFGTLTLIEPDQPVVLEKDGLRVQVTGQPFHYDLDRREIHLDYAVKNTTSSDFCIHMVHGMLVDRPLPEGVAHTLVHQLWELDSDWDLLLTGHYHAGFPIQSKEGRYIVNPGAIARVNNQLSEISRMPQVLYIELSETIHLELIPLSCAKPGEEVLDRSHLEKAQFRQQKWALFVQEISAAGEYQGLQIEEIINEIVQLEGIDENVKKEALRRIAIAQESEGESER
jgi:DNA repair protein SbcD/Mre11